MAPLLTAFLIRLVWLTFLASQSIQGLVLPNAHKTATWFSFLDRRQTISTHKMHAFNRPWLHNYGLLFDKNARWKFICSHPGIRESTGRWCDSWSQDFLNSYVFVFALLIPVPRTLNDDCDDSENRHIVIALSWSSLFVIVHFGSRSKLNRQNPNKLTNNRLIELVKLHNIQNLFEMCSSFKMTLIWFWILFTHGVFFYVSRWPSTTTPFQSSPPSLPPLPTPPAQAISEHQWLFLCDWRQTTTKIRGGTWSQAESVVCFATFVVSVV